MTLINFALTPRVALDFMNQDHESFAALANQLSQALLVADVDAKTIEDLLSQLLLHCQEHFGREQEQMEQYNFPPYPVHKAEHDQVLAGMEQALNHWRESADIDQLNAYLAELPKWFDNHIATMDTVTANFIYQMSAKD